MKKGNHLNKSAKQKVKSLLKAVNKAPNPGLRMQKIAKAFLGRPYIANQLIGGPQKTEKLVVDLDSFDCVTYIESVLALSRSKSIDGFIRELKKTRYQNGVIDWRKRLHYFYDWMKANHKRQAIKIRTKGQGSKTVLATLGFVEGLRPRTVHLDVVPKQKINQALKRIDNGSIVAFASTRSKLDFFHTGFLFYKTAEKRDIKELELFHASRSKKRVVAQPFVDFLSKNRMRGIAFASPM